jgi:hypothetical protein
MPQRWRRLQPLLGEQAHGRNLHHNSQDERPLPATPLSTMQPTHFGRTLTGTTFARTTVGIKRDA